MYKIKQLIYIIFIGITLISCSNTKRIYRSKTISRLLKNSNNIKALEVVSKKDNYSNKDKLLYYMDNGILNFYNDSLKSSFYFLEKADRYQEELYTESVKDNISSFLVNDNQKKYKGEDYELLYLNIFKALSFLKKNKLEKALVEVRKGYNKMRLFETRYRKDKAKLEKSMNDKLKSNMPDIGDYNFSESTLMLIISMIAHRDDGESDEALIDKKKIQEIWKLYPQLYNFNKPNLDNIKLIKPKDSVVLNIFAFSGLTSEKRAWELDVYQIANSLIVRSNTSGEEIFAMPFSGNVGSFSISLPYIKKRKNNIEKVKLFVNGKKYKELNIIENTSNILINQFKQKKNIILLKSLIRSTAKAMVTYKLNQQANKNRSKNNEAAALFQIASLASSLLFTAIEEADIRCWNTLPDNFYFDEITLPKGKHKIDIIYTDISNRILKRTSHKVLLDKKKKTNLILSYGF